LNEKERELKKLVDEVESTHVSVPPLFELFTTLFSILVAIMLFAYPDMIYNYPARLYDHMMNLMPQYMWAMLFFISCMFKSIGLLTDKNMLRVIGLVLSVVVYGLMTFCYALDFPSIGSITFACMALFSVISIPFVKYTSIKHKKE